MERVKALFQDVYNLELGVESDLIRVRRWWEPLGDRSNPRALDCLMSHNMTRPVRNKGRLAGAGTASGGSRKVACASSKKNELILKSNTQSVSGPLVGIDGSSPGGEAVGPGGPVKIAEPSERSV